LRHCAQSMPHDAVATAQYGDAIAPYVPAPALEWFRSPGPLSP
jgi:hypothetical protein